MEPLNKRYFEFGKENKNFLMLVGSLFAIFVVVLVKFMIYALTGISSCKKIKCIAKFRNSISDGLVWNEMIEFIFSGYSEFLFGLALHNEKNWANEDILPNIFR